MFGIKNPIPDSVRDTGKLSTWWGAYFKDKRLFIPYYGDSEGTSHNMLKVIHDLCRRSPSYKALEKDIQRYVFGSKIRAVEKLMPGVETEEEAKPLGPDQQRSFFLWLKKLGIPPQKIIKCSKILDSHKSQSGNAYLRLRFVNVGGAFKASIKVEHYRYVAKLAKERVPDDMAIVVVDWEPWNWQQNGFKPDIVAVTDEGEEFNWSVVKNGKKETIIETLIHFKTEGNDESDYYGRPDILAVLDWMYAEIALGDLSCKVNSTEKVAQDILLFEQGDRRKDKGGDDDEEEVFATNIRVLRNLVTASGNKVSSLAALQYEKDTKEPKSLKLGMNRDTAWFKENMGAASRKIAQVMGWSFSLVDAENVKGGIGSDILLNLFITKNAGTVEPRQQYWETQWGWIIDELAALTNQPQYLDVGIKFPDKIKRVIDALKESKTESKDEEDSNQSGGGDLLREDAE